MNLFTLILTIYVIGAIAAIFVIKLHNKHETCFLEKVPPHGMFLSWFTVLIILAIAIANFWESNGKESFNKFFNY
jgi:uncharacterized membrane protein